MPRYSVSRPERRAVAARGLACVLGVSPPPLLILDEPTNNLDLDSIAAVEAGLRAYDGALLVVSHDEGVPRGHRHLASTRPT